jgi:hypothetical protein
METDPIGRLIDWRKQYERLQSAFTELQTAANKAVTDKRTGAASPAALAAPLTEEER